MVGAPMMHDDSRTATLRAIETALAGAPVPQLPAPMEIFGMRDTATTTALALRFRDELTRVGGETRFVAREEDLPAAIAAYASERGLGSASVDYATADYALLQAEALLADTGSAIVIERGIERRLAPYLPRTCIIVGHAADLHAHLTADAAQPIFNAARSGDRGEALIITGPSRTADVEKILVLGAHGPRHVVVFIAGIDPETGERT
jgi:L-lactate dehydrogenase complex protein LldG